MKLKYFIPMALILLVLVGVAEAHSWYQSSCCGGQDCHPVPCEELIKKGTSYFWNTYEFTKDVVYPSKDQFCHVCITGIGTEAEYPTCAFIQLGF